MSKLCPSYACVEDALLIGVVQADGTVALANQPFAITQEFVDTARNGRPPEARFRFAGPCEESGCAQWKHGQCGIPGRVRKALPAGAEAPQAAARCAIRDRCRWFAQDSFAACRLCPLVTTRDAR